MEPWNGRRQVPHGRKLPTDQEHHTLYHYTTDKSTSSVLNPLTFQFVYLFRPASITHPNRVLCQNVYSLSDCTTWEVMISVSQISSPLAPLKYGLRPALIRPSFFQLSKTNSIILSKQTYLSAVLKSFNSPFWKWDIFYPNCLCTSISL